MLSRQKLCIILLGFLDFANFQNVQAWGDYATESDYEDSFEKNAQERNTAREAAEEAEHERVQNWGKKSFKDKLSSISLFRNRNTYSEASNDRNTVSLSEALKLTFGKQKPADESIVKARKSEAAQDTINEQFARNAIEIEKQRIELEKQRQQKAENIRIQHNLNSLETEVYRENKISINTALTDLGFPLEYIDNRNDAIPSKNELDLAYNTRLQHVQSLDLDESVKNRLIEKLNIAKKYFDQNLPKVLAQAKLRAIIRS